MENANTLEAKGISNPQFLTKDAFLLALMAVLAGCGLIYEYLLTHYSGLVLGKLEHTLYIMIGLMIVSMGVGAYLARYINNPFNGFINLELGVAFLGTTLLILISIAVGFSHALGDMIARAFDLPQSLAPQGDFVQSLKKLTMTTPYLSGALIGILIGMEIPLIGRVREFIYNRHVKHNLGTLYGADYVGAGIGAFIWVVFLLQLNMAQVGAYVALTNLVVGFIFLIVFKSQVNRFKTYLVLHMLLALLCALVIALGPQWMNRSENLLYKDPVVFSADTKYQHLTITKRPGDYLQFFINGHLQFSTLDEHIYHEMLVHPVMAIKSNTKNVLVIGGGDGLAVREVLKWNIDRLTLLDLDRELVDLFAGRINHNVSEQLKQLNKNALNHPRVRTLFNDAFIAIDALYDAKERFDVVIIDLPDPSHPDLNRLYSVHFYNRLRQLLSDNGRVVVQSTSPFFAKDAFISIGNTLAAAGFNTVVPMRTSIPSFGEWGFNLAFPGHEKPHWQDKNLPETRWLTNELIEAARAFPKEYFTLSEQVLANHLGTHQLYQYHQRAWEKFQ